MYELCFVTQIGLVIVLFCLIFNLVMNITKAILDARTFINSVTEEMNKTQLKSESFRILKFQIIKNLEQMKSNFKVSLLAIIVVSMLLVFVGCQTSNNTKLEQKEKELSTVVEKNKQTLDSIGFCFQKQQSQIDSLRVVCVFKDSLLLRCLDDVKKLGDTNKNLNNTIKHQNQMITNLQKK